MESWGRLDSGQLDAFSKFSQQIFDPSLTLDIHYGKTHFRGFLS